MSSSSDEKLNEICLEFEKLQIKLNEQRYNQTAGLEYDKKIMEEMSEGLVKLSKDFLANYKEPRSLYLGSIASIAQAKKLPISLEIYENRSKILSIDEFQVHEKPVNWGSWRQFNATEEDDKNRRKVFDYFIQKAPELAPLILKRFNISRQVYELYESSPLDSYLERESIEYDKLKDFIITLGDGARKSFLAAADHFAPEILLERDHSIIIMISILPEVEYIHH